MNEVKRYNPKRLPGCENLHHTMEESIDGRYVEYSELEKTQRLLNMVLSGIYDHVEPSSDPEIRKTREWNSDWGIYLRGCVHAMSSFTPEEWSEISPLLKPTQ